MNKKEEKTVRKKVTPERLQPRCEEFTALLAEYWEGDAPPGLKAEIEAHSQDCPECKAIFESYRQTVTVCRTEKGAPEHAPSHKQLWDELFRQIQALHDYLDT
jgi:anti-sigma factor RsiW